MIALLIITSSHNKNAYYTGLSGEFTGSSIGYKEITFNCETLSIMSSYSASKDISIHV